jgi:hypothetical protein
MPQHVSCSLQHDVCCFVALSGHFVRLLQRGRLFLESIYSDDAFADRAAHKLNKWCAIIQWVAYNLAAILIFAINSHLYRVN